MIEFLKINDLALLDKAQIEFSGGFTVVTGETGAGKSVLLGALSILAGNRCPKEAIRKGADACRVEASLSFGDTSKIDAYLEENGVNPCEDGALVLSRAISREKSGRVFINGTLTSLSTLAGLGEFWIDFHGPGEPQKLFSQKNQLSMLDSFAGNEKLTEKYLALYAERADILRRIEAAKNSKRLSPDEMEFLQKQIAAIDALKLSPESVDELEEKSKLAEMASEIVEKSGAIVELLNGENGALGMISGANRLAGELRAAGDAALSLGRRLSEACIEISDIADEFESLARSSDMGEDEIEAVREKMSEWLGLARKYGGTAERVLEARNEMANRIAMQGDVKATLEKLGAEEKGLLEKMAPVAEEILKSRKKAAKRLSESVQKILGKLGFKKAVFDIELTAQKDPGPSCGSACEFVFSANPGQPPLSLAKIASSGELARVMLALKTTLADADSTPVLVFDEVDANVGGEIGAEVGRELARLAKRHQVFCVTHLPQVAAFGDNHLLVEKKQTDTSTSVVISDIGGNKKKRVGELARMLGDRNSESAIAHAEKLLDKSL